jgi:Flp pilus assembly pilin Flp
MTFDHKSDVDRGTGAQEEAPSGALRRCAERGASVVEYALLVALITVACLTALTYFGQSNDGLVEGSSDKIVTAQSG